MNYIDLIIFLILVVFGLLGFRRGLAREAADLAILLISFGSALVFYSGLASFLGNLISLPETFVKAGAFFVIWFIVELILYIASSYALAYIPEEVIDSRWNKWCGVALGVVKAAGIIALVMATLVILPLGKEVDANIHKSLVGRQLQGNSKTVGKFLEATFGEVASNLARFATVTSGSRDKVALGYKIVNPTPDAVSADRMFARLNAEREKAGLKPLKADEKLAKVAVLHGKDMFSRGYLSHYTPEGKSAFDRMKAAGISSFFAGENLAIAADTDEAMTGLLASPGHKANMLSGDYGKVGIAVFDGGVHGKIFVQEFTD